MNRIFFFLHCKDKATFSTLQTFVQKYLNFCAILRVSKTFYVAQHKNPPLLADAPAVSTQNHPMALSDVATQPAMQPIMIIAVHFRMKQRRQT